MALSAYEVIGEIGRGALGVVRSAVQRATGRRVALKELPGAAARDPDLAGRLRVLSSLRHPNIIPIYDCFEEGGTAYVATELVEGGSLRRRIADLSLADVGRVLEDVLAAIGSAAAAGIAHRDLKPENVLITADGQVKVGDFGIATVAAPGLTAAGMALDAPYAAPEQVEGGELGDATDLYAIGCMTYEMLTGQAPFAERPAAEAVLAHALEDVPDVRAVDPLIPAQVAEWVARMTQRDPRDRYPDAGSAWRAFDAAIGEALGRRWRRSSRLAPPPAPRSGDGASLPDLVREAERAGVVLQHVGMSASRTPAPAVTLPLPADDELAQDDAAAFDDPTPSDDRPLATGVGLDRPPDAPTSHTTGRRLPRIARLAALAAAGVATARLLGLFTLDVAPPQPEDTVDCTVFAPPAAAPGEAVLIQLFAHLPLQDGDARALATEFDSATARRAVRGLKTPVARGTTLTFALELPGARIDDPVQSLVWQGRAAAVQFGAVVDPGTAPQALLATVAVTQRSIPVGHIKFKLDVLAQPAQGTRARLPVGDDACRYRSAFLSYATPDRDHVIRGAQMLRSVRIECFQDILDLDPGERWERRLYDEIERSDLFLLFWSRAARESEWVRREARHALGCKAGELDRPEIKPIVLDPDPLEPWPELAHLHFQDALTYFLAGTDGS